MNDFFTLLENIKKNHAPYIGKRCPMRLESFLHGWLLGKGMYDSSPLAEFNDWVAEKYSVQSGQSWSDILIHFSEGNVAAFEKFFQLLDMFWKVQEEDGRSPS